MRAHVLLSAAEPQCSNKKSEKQDQVQDSNLFGAGQFIDYLILGCLITPECRNNEYARGSRVNIVSTLFGA